DPDTPRPEQPLPVTDRLCSLSTSRRPGAPQRPVRSSALYRRRVGGLGRTVDSANTISDIQSPISSSGGEGTLDDDAHLRRKAMNRAESYRSHTPGSGTDRGSKKRRSAARLVPAALTLLAATLSGCASGSDEVADNPEDFFEGKTITWIVPHTAG